MRKTKTPIALFVTDTHLEENTIEINKKIFAEILEVADALGIKIVIHGGDIFTSRIGQPEVVLNAFNEILNSFKERGVRMVAIAGNHDKTDYTSEESFLVPFDNHEAFDLIKPYGLVKPDHNINIFMLPYYDEKLAYLPMLERVISMVDAETKNILITHVAVNGVKSNGGAKVENDIAEELFDVFDLVLVGHYHDRQLLGTNGQIIYTGSAYQANFGENDEKGCCILYDDGSLDFYQLEFPRFVNHKIEVQEINEELMKAIKASPGNHKLKVTGKITKEKEALINQLSEMGVRVETVTESFDPLQPQVVASVQLTDNDILSEFDSWGKEKKYQDINFGRELLVGKIH